jgi:hypothetical protein
MSVGLTTHRQMPDLTVRRGTEQYELPNDVKPQSSPSLLLAANLLFSAAI